MISFIEKMKLANQLRMSFLLLVTLLIVVSISSYIGLLSLLYSRLNVLKYINENDPEALADFKQRILSSKEFVTEAQDSISNPIRLGLIEQSINNISLYENHFETVVSLIAKRNEIVNTELDPAGKAMRVLVTELLDANQNAANEQVIP